MNENFTEIQRKNIDELKTLGTLYKHKATGAEVIILENDDENKVFGIGYKTLPEDNTGVAHILEHLVFNGTKTYPVKNLIDEFIKGSVNTYVNAFTSLDRTVYPIASQNEKDFYNLAEVYISMTLEPLLSKEGFLQEGWRLEKDEAGETRFSGIVYNEMKAYSLDPNVVIWRKILSHGLKNSIYANESGGDPTEIPNLTHEKLIDFHKRYYNVSNAKFVFYGNGNPSKHLDFLHNHIRSFTPNQQKENIKPFKKFNPLKVEESVPTTDTMPSENQYSYVKAWFFGNDYSLKDRYGMYLLNYLLLTSESAQLKNDLIAAGIAEDLVDDGFELDFAFGMFMIGVKNGKKDEVSKAEKIIMSRLKHHAEHGFKTESIKAAIEVNELSLREVGGANPRGLALFRKMLTRWNYDLDPLTILSFEEIYAEFRNTLLKNDSYLRSIIKKYILDNDSQVTITFSPDETFEQKLEAASKKLLNSFIKRKKTAEIKSDIEQLRKYQVDDPQEEVAKLPSLTLLDLSKKNKVINHETLQISNAKVLVHNLPTNGIVDLVVSLDISHLNKEELQYTSFLLDIISRLETKDYSRDEFADLVDTYSSGLRLSTIFDRTLLSKKDISRIHIGIKGLYRNAPKLIELLHQCLNNLVIKDPKVIVEELMRIKGSLESGLLYNGHAYAIQYSKSAYSRSTFSTELTSGIRYLQFIRKLLEISKTDPDLVLEKLNATYKKLFSNNDVRITFASESEFLENANDLVTKVMQTIPSHSYNYASVNPESTNSKLAFSANTDIQFNALSFPIDLTEAPLGSISTVNKLASLNYVWKNIRLKIGAYGAGMRLNPNQGILSFFSYRDPGISPTFDTFLGVSNYLKNIQINKDELIKGIIGSIGDMDTYIPVFAKPTYSLSRDILEITDEYRDTLREQIFQTTQSDFNMYGEIITSASKKGKKYVTIGNKQAIVDSGLFEEDIPLL